MNLHLINLRELTRLFLNENGIEYPKKSLVDSRSQKMKVLIESPNSREIQRFMSKQFSPIIEDLRSYERLRELAYIELKKTFSEEEIGILSSDDANVVLAHRELLAKSGSLNTYQKHFLVELIEDYKMRNRSFRGAKKSV